MWSAKPNLKSRLNCIPDSDTKFIQNLMNNSLLFEFIVDKTTIILIDRNDNKKQISRTVFRGKGGAIPPPRPAQPPSLVCSVEQQITN